MSLLPYNKFSTFLGPSSLRYPISGEDYIFASSLTGDKQYTFEEILPIYKKISGEEDTGTFADFQEGFKTFDREGQGYMSAAELRNVITMMGM